MYLVFTVTFSRSGKSSVHLVRLFPFLWFSENFPVAGNGDLGGFLSIKNGRSVRGVRVGRTEIRGYY